ncbi:11004_t:CDS:1, partial [Funneliformis caledonium]
NTNYMIGIIDGAVAKFNQLFKTNTFQIPCALHIAHIISTNFEEIAFGKTSATIGFTKEKHSFNLLYFV